MIVEGEGQYEGGEDQYIVEEKQYMVGPDGQYTEIQGGKYGAGGQGNV